LADSTEGAFRIEVVDPTADPRWAALVGGVASSVFHSPAWARVLDLTYGYSVRAALVVDPDGRPVGGIPYIDLDDLGERRKVSLPFSDFCDPLITGSQGWAVLADAILEGGAQVEIRCLRSPFPAADDRFDVVTRSAWHGVGLERGTEEIWGSLHEAARRSIRKARGAGVEVRRAEDIADLRAFFDLHLRVRKQKYGLLAQPFRFFESIWEQFLVGGEGALLLALHQGKPIGGVLYLRWKDTLYYKFNASDPSWLEFRPNDFLVWEGINMARDQGLRLFDFGLSDYEQEGLVRYKRKYASEERSITVVRSMGAGIAGEVRKVLGKVTELMVDESVPDAVTERAGDLLYRYFA
jgi:CelD/BcsL family acetyltransferase involved in cellulose biosynthesis